MCIYSEKLLRMFNHRMYTEMQNPTKNRPKRASFNQLHRKTMMTSYQHHQPLLNFEEADDHLGGARSSWKFLKVTRTAKLLTCWKNWERRWLQTNATPPSESTSSQTDPQKEQWEMDHRLHETHRQKTDLQGFSNWKDFLQLQSEVDSTAVKTLSRSTKPPPKMVFFTDCISLLQGLQKWNKQHPRNIKMIFQRSPPAHSEITENETADALSKTGSKMEQFSQSVIYRLVWTLLYFIWLYSIWMIITIINL